MKLNKKGYMLVEIIVSFVITMAIAMSLINITLKFKNTSEDIYYSAIFTSEKIAITKNIMNDLEKNMKNYDIGNCENDYGIPIENCIILNSEQERKKIQIVKENENTIIKYGNIDNSGNFNPNNASYYEKTINNLLLVGNIEINQFNEAATIKIPLKSLYDKKDYDIILTIKKKIEPM